MGALESFLGSATGGATTGLASGLLNFGLGQIGAAIQHKRNKQLMDKAQEQELEQMEKSQEYNLANMEVQNQYQIDAENRANEWNSAESQVQRAREAGISPLAALGSGGAGGSMGVSSAPSSSTPQGSGSSPATGSASSATFNLAQAMQAGAQIGLMASEKSKVEAQANEAQSNADYIASKKVAQDNLNKFYQEHKEEIDRGTLSESNQKYLDYLIDQTKWTGKDGNISMDSAGGRNLEADTADKNAGANKKNEEAADLRESRPYRIEEKKQIANYYKQNAALLKGRVSLLDIEEQIMRQDLENKAAEYWNILSASSLKEAEIDNIRSAILKLEKEVDLSEAELEWYTAMRIADMVKVGVSVSQEVLDWTVQILTKGAGKTVETLVEKTTKGKKGTTKTSTKTIKKS